MHRNAKLKGVLSQVTWHDSFLWLTSSQTFDHLEAQKVHSWIVYFTIHVVDGTFKTVDSIPPLISPALTPPCMLVCTFLLMQFFSGWMNYTVHVKLIHWHRHFTSGVKWTAWQFCTIWQMQYVSTHGGSASTSICVSNQFCTRFCTRGRWVQGLSNLLHWASPQK